MRTFLQDIRYALRGLAKKPGFTAAALLTLAVGVGATTATFSVVNAVLLRPLPYPHPDKLLRIEERHADSASGNFTPANFADLAGQSKTLEQIAAYRPWLYNLSGGQEPENVDGYMVSGEFFRALDVQPIYGRTFTPEEMRPGNDAAVILSYGLWERLYGGEPAAIGRLCKINDVPSRIVGVMPRGFAYPADAQIWTPLAPDNTLRQNRRSHVYSVIARQAPGASLAEVRAELPALASVIDHDSGKMDPDWTAHAAPLQERIVASVRSSLVLLFGAAGLVLLIACSNVANLLLVRAVGRRQEMAVRVSLGAARARLLAQLLTESVLLSLIGSALGLAFASVALKGFLLTAPAGIPSLDHVSIDYRVLLFVVGISVLCGALFGLAPVLQAFRVDLQRALRETRRSSPGAGQARILDALAVSEISLALILLIGAALLTNSFVRLLRSPLGFNPENVLTMELFVPSVEEGAANSRSTAFFRESLQGIRSIPGVESAGLINSLPIEGGAATDFDIVGRPAWKPSEEPSADIRVIDPGYVPAMQIALLAGRNFTERDTFRSPRVMVINQAMAKRFWPGENAVGARVTMKDWGPPMTGEVVGIVADTKVEGPEVPARPMIYWPYTQFPSLFNYLVIRTAGNPEAMAVAVKASVWSVNAEQPLAQIRTMTDVLRASLAQRRFSLFLAGFFAASALLLAAVGIGGVMAFSVAQRTREMGIRMALGAQPGEIMTQVLKQGLRLTAWGVLAGLAGTYAFYRVLADMLFEVQPNDPLTIGAAVAFLLAAVATACYLPARRATQVDPLVALRYE